jgi:hypothetical protein
MHGTMQLLGSEVELNSALRQLEHVFLFLLSEQLNKFQELLCHF